LRKSAKLLTVLGIFEVRPNLSKKIRHISTTISFHIHLQVLLIFQIFDAVQCQLLTAPSHRNILTCIPRFLSAFQNAVLTYSKNLGALCLVSKAFVKYIHFKLSLNARNMQNNCVRKGRLVSRSSKSRHCIKCSG